MEIMLLFGVFLLGGTTSQHHFNNHVKISVSVENEIILNAEDRN